MVEMRDLASLYMLLLESSDLLVLMYNCKFWCPSANLGNSKTGYTYGRPL